MSTPTDYRFNLDRIHRIFHDVELPIQRVRPLLTIPLSLQQVIFLQNGLLQARFLRKIIEKVDKIRATRKVFLRLSTISSKDVDIDWSEPDTMILLRQFISSERVNADLLEACNREASIALIVLPFVNYTHEYRTFIKNNDVEATRSDAGLSIVNEVFQETARILTKHLLVESDITSIDYVFDVGYNVDEQCLCLIELNQYDDTTDLYEA